MSCSADNRSEPISQLFPVMEFEDYMKLRGSNPVIDHVSSSILESDAQHGDSFIQVFHLQHYDTKGTWEPTIVEADCDFGTYPGTNHRYNLAFPVAKPRQVLNSQRIVTGGTTASGASAPKW